MKTKYQKEARELLNRMPSLSAIDLGTRTAGHRCLINGEAYITIGSLSGDRILEKLRKYAKENNWNALDMFPASVSNPQSSYGAVAHVVRVKALTNGGDTLKELICRDDTFQGHNERRYDEVISKANLPWPDSDHWRFKNRELTEDMCRDAISFLKERNRLLRIKPEEDEPDIETCINVLKKHGYKVMQPIVEYKEV